MKNKKKWVIFGIVLLFLGAAGIGIYLGTPSIPKENKKQEAPVQSVASITGYIEEMTARSRFLGVLAPVSYTHLDVYKRQALGAGEFFVTGIYSYSAESAEMYCRNAYEMDESIQLLAVELPEFNQSFSGKGNKACVLEGSKNKEEAIHILSLIYSEKDFSDALAGSAFGNPFLTSPGEGESESINKELWDTVETIHPAELNGFFFDMTEIGMTVSEVNTLIQDDYMWKFSGNSEDWKAELKKIEETLERMGIQEVVDNMNQQLNTKN